MEVTIWVLLNTILNTICLKMVKKVNSMCILPQFLKLGKKTTTAIQILTLTTRTLNAV